MESSSLDFKSSLTQNKFKLLNHNQVEHLGYDELFSKKRVIVFSLTFLYSPSSFNHVASYGKEFPGIDAIYCINSHDPFIIPYIDVVSKNIIGIFDVSGDFVKVLADKCNLYVTSETLKYWQFVTILNDGNLEKIWSNPIKDNMSRKILCNAKYQYRKLNSEIVESYLGPQ